MNARTQGNIILRHNAQHIFYYQGETLVQEINPQLNKLRFLYSNPFGRLVRQIMKFKSLSKLVGRYYDSPASARSIPRFIEQHHIDMSDYEQTTYTSFNDFFTRKLNPGKRVINQDPQILASPCDAKLFVIPHLSSKSLFYLKELPFNLERFIGNKAQAQQYSGGTLMIFRLAPYDYHRFHFPVDCIATPARHINGLLESVNPLVYKKGIQVLTQNERHCIELQTMHHGNMLMVPVGALCVGKIIETYPALQPVKKGHEAGYFMFGGSTVALVIPPGKITVEQRFIKNSALGFETAVKMGEAIATFNEKKNLEEA